MREVRSNFPIAHILENPKKEWPLLTRPKNVRVAYRELDVDWSVYKPDSYLFSHISILTSCETEENGYQIVEPCDELVNANGNAWTNQGNSAMLFNIQGSGQLFRAFTNSQFK